MHVICDDEDIRDSPFIAHIQPAPPDCFPDKVWPQVLHTTWGGASGPPPSPTQPSSLVPAQVKAFGPGLEPTGCIVDKPAEFTIDARAAGKGDLKLYAQVGHCPISLPPSALGRDPGREGERQGPPGITGRILMRPLRMMENLTFCVFLLVSLKAFDQNHIFILITWN